MSGPAILSDLGEREIIRRLLAPRYSGSNRHFGDDSVSVRLDGLQEGVRVVASTDPCPPPMAAQLGFDLWFYGGWLLGTINLSDLAAAGAEPLGLLTALQMPGSTKITEFERLLEGLDACAAQAGTAVLGGNLKEASALDMVATAIGICDGELLGRSGAAEGDLVIVIGDLGRFWAGVLAHRNGLVGQDETHPLLANVLKPEAKIESGLALRRQGLVSACIDNSDGLYPSLLQLGEANGFAVQLDLNQVVFDVDVLTVAERLGVEPFRMALGFGDWQLVVACHPQDLADVERVADSTGAQLHVVGTLQEGSGVVARVQSTEGPLLPLDSERFRQDSWFTSGIDGYITAMLEMPLVAEQHA